MSGNPSLLVGNVSFNTIVFVDYTSNFAGVNTTTPNQTLTVNGNAYISGNLTSSSNLYISQNAYIYEDLFVSNNISASNGVFSLDLIVQNALITNQLVIQNAVEVTGNAYILGSLGVGTTAPAEKLQVVGNIAFGDSTGYEVLFANASYGSWRTQSGTNAISVNQSNGYVGVGTTNPTNPVHILGNVLIQGNLSVFGTETIIDTNVQVTDRLEITNDGTGPALVVNQNGSQPVADFRDETVSVLFIADGGNVGVGTTSPASKLDIWNGALTLHGDATTESLSIFVTTSNFALFQSPSPESINWIEYNNPTRSLTLGGLVSQSADRLWIVSNGNVGMGTSSPSNKLTVLGPTATDAATSAIKFGDSSGSGYLAAGSGSIVIFNDGGTNALAISQANANVGIGTNSPAYDLDVNGTTRTTNLLVKDGQPNNVFTVGTCFAPVAALAFNTSDTSLVNHSAALSLANYDITDNSSVFISFDSKNGNNDFVSGAQIAAKFVAHPVGGGYPNTDLVFTTVSSTSQATERLRIASSGNIGINTSVPNNTLTVNGNAYIADNLIVQNTVFIENSVTLNDNLYVLGCVGIGSTTPTTKFDIVGNNLSGYISKIENTNAEGFGLLIQVNHDGDTDKPMLMLQNATNEYFAVKGAGPSYFLGSGVGIGTTNPAYKLDVYDSIRANTNLLVNSTNLFDFTGYTVNGSFTAVATQSAMAINYTKTSSLIETPAVLTLRNVKQDSVTPSSSEPIQVPLRFAVFDGDTGGSTVGIGQISALCTGRTANNFAVGDLAFLVGRQSSNAGLNEVMRIASNGNVGIGITNPAYQLHLSTDNAAKLTTNTWTTTSDMRVKEDIETADYNLCEELMNQLELRYYKYKDNIPGFENVTDRHRLGWIAQEVEKVFPKSVTTIDKQGELENFKMLNTDQIYAMMFGTIKKLIKDKEQILKELQEIQNKMKVLG